MGVEPPLTTTPDVGNGNDNDDDGVVAGTLGC